MEKAKKQGPIAAPRTVISENQNKTLAEFFTTENIQILICRGDIVAEKSDAIVSSANRHLKHEFGVAKAIAESAGQPYIDECKALIQKMKRIDYQQAVHTGAGNLPHLKYVVHTVPPRADSGDAFRDSLENSVVTALVYANRELHVPSLSLPLIGAGFYGASSIDVACVIYRALVRYSVSIPPGIRHLTSIRLIDKDPSKVEALIRAFKDVSDNDTSLHKIVLEDG